MSISELSEQELVRRNSLQKIKELGIDPYPAAQFHVNVSTSEIKANYNPELNNYQEVIIAGRIMSRRIMGKASFAEIQDSSGRIQLYINRDEICPEEDKTLYNEVFKKLLDIGDIIGVKGFTFITQTGELSIHVMELIVLRKSIRPLPIVKEKDGQLFDAVTDPEMLYPQRYVHMNVNPRVT